MIRLLRDRIKAPTLRSSGQSFRIQLRRETNTSGQSWRLLRFMSTELGIDSDEPAPFTDVVSVDIDSILSIKIPSTFGKKKTTELSTALLLLPELKRKSLRIIIYRSREAKLLLGGEV